MSDNERIEVALQPVSPELEGPVAFGPGEPDFFDAKLAGTIAKSPIGRAFRDVVEECGHEYLSTSLDEEHRLWLIPHRFSLFSRSRQIAVTAAGLDVEYDVGGKTCSVVQLWPAPEYRLDASLDLHVRARTPLEDSTQLRLKIGTFEVGVGPTAEVRFQAGVVRPLVSALGVGSRGCSWELLGDDPPLIGRDIETWSLLLLPKSMTRPLKYRARAWARHRSMFVPTRVESGWIEVSCKLIGA